MKSQSTVTPQTILNLGNGKYHFNYNVTTLETDEGVMYEYDTVEVNSPTYDEIVFAIIRDKVSESQELAMMNKYNAYKANIGGDLKSVDEYEGFLRWVQQVKQLVKSKL